MHRVTQEVDGNRGFLNHLLTAQHLDHTDFRERAQPELRVCCFGKPENSSQHPSSNPSAASKEEKTNSVMSCWHFISCTCPIWYVTEK